MACLRRLAAAGRGDPAWIVAQSSLQNALDGEAVDFVLDVSGAARHRMGVKRPPLGIWSFELEGGDPPGWRAMVADARSFRAHLVGDLDDGSVVLQQGQLPVSTGYRGLRARLIDLLSGWPVRAAAEAESGDWPPLRRAAPSVPERPLPHATMAERTRWFCTAPLRRVWRWWREMARYDTWNVGIAVCPSPLIDIQQLQVLGRVTWLPPRPPRYFIADPFPYWRHGRTFLLVEDYGHAKGVRGHIARVDVDGDTGRLHRVLTRCRHISYPCTFAFEGRVHCIVEMSQEDGCAIYQLDDEDRWTERYHILPGRRVVDPTLFEWDERWWLFGTDTRAAGNLVLHAYYAAAPSGPWMPHPLNPLKCDLASARPAGRPLKIGGRLYRPAQDCSRSYGGAVTLMEVTELTTARFRERPAVRLEPDPDWPYPNGLHTVVVDGDRVFIDAKRQRYDYLLWLKVWL